MQPQAGTKLVAKIKAIHPIRLKSGQMVGRGQVVECSEEEAKEFCDVTLSGQYDFSGERTGKVPFPKFTRAVRVTE
jgi:hypothetical protein